MTTSSPQSSKWEPLWQQRPVFQTPKRSSHFDMASSQVQLDSSCDHWSNFVGQDESPSQAAPPPCITLPAPSSDTDVLPSEQIPKDKLVGPQSVLIKYKKLRGEALSGTLDVKLAREAYFGQDVMRKCTVRGNRGLPGLPHMELCQLKQTLFSVFPQFWPNPVEFEPVWTRCSAAIGQACKTLRAKSPCS